jgi:hypothetical protein
MSTAKPVGHICPMRPEALHPTLDQTALPDQLDLLLHSQRQADETAVGLDVQIHGTRFRVTVSDACFAERIRTMLWQDEAGTQVRQTAQVTIRHDGSVLPRWGEAWFNERTIEAQLALTSWRLHHLAPKGFWQVWDRERHRGLQLAPSPEMIPDWEPDAPLRHFLHWHFGDLGMRMTHAGTLGVGGRGIALAGKGGSGKSGTVLGGVLAGMTSVGDDYILVKTGPAGVTAYPVFRTLKQDLAGLSRLGVADRLTAGRKANWQDKFTFPSTAVAAEWPATLPLVALAIPQVAHKAETTITPISARDAFLALAPSGVSQIAHDRDRGFAAYADIARALPTYSIALGTDPAEVADTIGNFISRGAA